MLNEISKLEANKQQKNEETDWLTTQTKEIEISRNLNELKLKETRIKEYEKKIQDIKNLKEIESEKKFRTLNEAIDENTMASDIEDENILLDDIDIVQEYLSDEEDLSNTYEPIKVILIFWYSDCCKIFF